MKTKKKAKKSVTLSVDLSPQSLHSEVTYLAEEFRKSAAARLSIYGPEVTMMLYGRTVSLLFASHFAATMSIGIDGLAKYGSLKEKAGKK